MLSFALAAGLVLGSRPPELVKPGEEADYAAWIEGEARTQAGYYAHKDCTSATLAPKGFDPAHDEALERVRPGAPQFVEAFGVEGCGEAATQKLLVLREARGWRALPLAPGDSLASLALQREVLPSVILTVKAAADRDTSCSGLEKAQSALIYDTRVTEPPAASGQPWSERWFMAVCGAGYRIDIDFNPAAGSGPLAYQVRIAP